MSLTVAAVSSSRPRVSSDGAGKKATLAAGAALASPLVSSPARAVTASELAAELQDKLNAAAGVVEEVRRAPS